MNESQHDESHLEESEGKVHYIDTEQGKKEKEKEHDEHRKENDEAKVKTDKKEEESEGKVHYMDTEQGKKEKDKEHMKGSDEKKVGIDKKEERGAEEKREENKINEKIDKYMDYRHPRKEADPYLYSMYYYRNDKNDKK